MGRPRKKSLQFSTEDRNELQRIASSRTEPAARVSRARALLAYEDGEGTNGEIASGTGMSTVALANLVNKCISFGPMVALNDLPRSGRKSIITDEDKAYVKHIACYKPKDFGYPSSGPWRSSLSIFASIAPTTAIRVSPGSTNRWSGRSSRRAG